MLLVVVCLYLSSHIRAHCGRVAPTPPTRIHSSRTNSWRIWELLLFIESESSANVAMLNGSVRLCVLTVVGRPVVPFDLIYIWCTTWRKVGVSKSLVVCSVYRRINTDSGMCLCALLLTYIRGPVVARATRLHLCFSFVNIFVFFLFSMNVAVLE